MYYFLVFICFGYCLERRHKELEFVKYYTSLLLNQNHGCVVKVNNNCYAIPEWHKGKVSHTTYQHCIKNKHDDEYICECMDFQKIDKCAHTLIANICDNDTAMDQRRMYKIPSPDAKINDNVVHLGTYWTSMFFLYMYCFFSQSWLYCP